MNFQYCVVVPFYRIIFHCSRLLFMQQPHKFCEPIVPFQFTYDQYWSTSQIFFSAIFYGTIVEGWGWMLTSGFLIWLWEFFCLFYPLGYDGDTFLIL